MKVALAAITGTLGGPRTYALSLLRALSALEGPEEYVLLSDAPVSEAESGGVRRIAVPMPGGTLGRPLAEAVGFPWAARKARPDLYHGTKHTLPRALRCSKVVSVMDLAWLRLPETFTRGAAAYLQRSTAAGVRRADHVIAISECTKRDVVELLGVPEERISVTLLGIDEQYRRPVEAAEIERVRERHGLPAEYLLTAGTVQPRKNVDIVLDAVEALAGSREVPPLVVAGRAGWKSDDVVRRAKTSRHAVHLGVVPPEDLPALMAGALLVLSPSSYEGFGLVIAEAMAVGTVAIGGSGSACEEVVGDAGVLVPPRDADALADTIQRLLDGDTERHRLEVEGRERALQFTWAATARATRDVYRRVAGAPV